MDGRDLLFFSLGRLCVCTVFEFSFVNGTWDMMDWCLFSTVPFFRFSFFGIHGKGPGGFGFGLGWVGLLVHHIFLYFSGTHVW